MKGAGYECPNASLPLRVSPSLPYRDAYSSFDYGNGLFLRHSRTGSSKGDLKMVRENSHGSSCVTRWHCVPCPSIALENATRLWDPPESQSFQPIENSTSTTIRWYQQNLWTVKIERQRRSVTEEARSANQITHLANPFIGIMVMKVP